jgi:hypothetical protein
LLGFKNPESFAGSDLWKLRRNIIYGKSLGRNTVEIRTHTCSLLLMHTGMIEQ